MEGESSDMAREKPSHDANKASSEVDVDFFLPEDIVEHILSFLPTASILRAGLVCKKWLKIRTSSRFLGNLSLKPQKPWFFVFTNNDEPVGHAYDPVFRKWYPLGIPCITIPSLTNASCKGLVCFLDCRKTDLYICNPISKHSRTVQVPEIFRLSSGGSLAFSVEKTSYIVSFVMGNSFDWELSIYAYKSNSMNWISCCTEVLCGWKAGGTSAICNGILYTLICLVGGNQKGVISYNLSAAGSSHDPLMNGFIPVPCPLRSAHLLNLKERLVLVGGIGKRDRKDTIKGIGIWMLSADGWEEISRLPHKCFKGFGERDDVDWIGGADELVYIQSLGGLSLLVFDMNQRQWTWSEQCPAKVKYTWHLGGGFGFEPRVDAEP